MGKPTIASLLAANECMAAQLAEAQNRANNASVEAAALKRVVQDERDSHNLTRDILHSTELELARMRGHLEAKIDAEPPVMVPREREPFHARLSDGTRSFQPSSGSWADNAKRASWWHK